jgi:Kef-type K+ transport system membrane component KefB
MDFSLNSLLIIGIIFFIGLASDILGRKTPIPRVTFLIIIGILIGPSGINFLPEAFISNWFTSITTVALGMVGFLLGQQFTLEFIKKIGKSVFYIASFKVLISFLLLSILLYLCGVSFEVSLILAAIASATAPAAIYEVVHELKINNKFTKTLLAIVAFDDILALFLFSLVLSFLTFSSSSNLYEVFSLGVFEIIGSIVIGYIAGYPVAKITGRLSHGEPIMIEALGSVFIICGIALMFELSPILCAMAMGSAVATFATHHKTPFHAIKHIEWPFMVIFFLLAGASLNIESLLGVSFIGLVYIFGRVIGFYIGSRLGATISKSDESIKKLMGFALIPQAGVAIGMALMASQKIENTSDIILPIILGTTVFFEIVGPFVARYIIKKNSKN